MAATTVSTKRQRESWMPCECIALQTRGCESILKPSVVSSARFTNGAPEQSAVLSNLMSACWGWVRWVGTCFCVSGCVSTCTEPYSISLRIHVQKCCNYIKQSKASETVHTAPKLTYPETSSTRPQNFGPPSLSLSIPLCIKSHKEISAYYFLYADTPTCVRRHVFMFTTSRPASYASSM